MYVGSNYCAERAGRREGEGEGEREERKGVMKFVLERKGVCMRVGGRKMPNGRQAAL